MTFFKERDMKQDVYSLSFIIGNPHTYCFYDNNELKGYIFIAKHGKRLYLSGAAKPKIMNDVIQAIERVCNAYECTMYSDTDIKPAQLVLRKAGFKRIRNTNKFKRSK